MGHIGILVPNNQRQHRALHIQKDVLPYALRKFLCPVTAALASVFRMDSTSTSYVSRRMGGWVGKMVRRERDRRLHMPYWLDISQGSTAVGRVEERTFALGR